jgi:hypothetical protein
MDRPPASPSRVSCRVWLAAIVVLFAAISICGINWGLPTARNDRYLFSGEAPWPGEKIYRLAKAGEKLDGAGRGADVDPDPLDKASGEPILLTGTDEDIARIYLRYRLFTHQPDEMITMMALAGMRPSQLELDPKLYQYGGLFIYPIGAALKLCGMLGFIDVRSDVAWYLDHPDEFGKFYIVSRAYSAAWGLLGVVVVFAIGRRLGGDRAGLIAALLFTLMPVVICMAHEGKPHLPGAVLMLLAVWWGMEHVANYELRITNYELKANIKGKERAGLFHSLFAIRHSQFLLMSLACGAALGMVISSLPIFVLIPMVAVLGKRPNVQTSKRPNEGRGPLRFGLLDFWTFGRFLAGMVVAGLAYVVTNPYVVINAIVPSRREILRSNFGNSLAMYEIDRIVEGFVRVLELSIEGAGLPVVVFGAIGMVIALRRGRRGGTVADPRPEAREADAARQSPDPVFANGNRQLLILAVPAAVFFLQFVLIGAGKPAEYGRFGIFTNTALAIACACLLGGYRSGLRRIVDWVPASIVVCWVGVMGAQYGANFLNDRTDRGTRSLVASILAGSRGDPIETIRVMAEPAPYGFPPLDFRRVRVVLYPTLMRATARDPGAAEAALVIPYDQEAALPEAITGAAAAYVKTGSFFLDHAPTNAEAQGITPISWANKPFVVFAANGRTATYCIP